MKISKMNLAQVKQQIIFKQQKIKSLYDQIQILIKKETELIAEENDCKQFIPPRSEFNREHRCVNCGQFEAAHKNKVNSENLLETHLAKLSQAERLNKICGHSNEDGVWCRQCGEQLAL